MPKRRRQIDKDPEIDDRDPIDADPVTPPDPEPEPELDDGRALVVVMHPTNITLESQKSDANREGKLPFRSKARIPREEYEAVCALDDRAGRPHRLMEI